MVKILIVVGVLAISLLLGRCGSNSGRNNSGGDTYPSINPTNSSSPIAPVYYGPPVEEDDNNKSETYPDNVEDPVDVYFGPQD